MRQSEEGEVGMECGETTEENWEDEGGSCITDPPDITELVKWLQEKADSFDIGQGMVVKLERAATALKAQATTIVELRDIIVGDEKTIANFREQVLNLAAKLWFESNWSFVMYKEKTNDD